MLQIQDLQVQYGAIRALKGVSLEVKKGEIVALIGANGAGKSTLLKAVSGLVRPARGEVHLEGQDVRGLAPHRMVQLGLAYVPEGRAIFSNLTVAENLMIGAHLRRDRAESRKDCD